MVYFWDKGLSVIRVLEDFLDLRIFCPVYYVGYIMYTLIFITKVNYYYYFVYTLAAPRMGSIITPIHTHQTHYKYFVFCPCSSSPTPSPQNTCMCDAQPIPTLTVRCHRAKTVSFLEISLIKAECSPIKIFD